MGVTNLPLFSALADKMKWHQTRQNLLAENVANAETPGYRGRDLGNGSFERHLGRRSMAQVVTAATQPGHIVKAGGGDGAFGSQTLNSFEVTPEGNGVTLEGGTPMTAELFERTFVEELAVVRAEVGEERWASGRWDEAAQLMRDLCLQDEFAEFLTLSAYERL